MQPLQPLDSQYISLDFWDTILRRMCHPDEVKLYTAQRMLHLLVPCLEGATFSTLELLRRRQRVEGSIGNLQLQNGFDDEYEIEEVIKNCILDVIQSPIAGTQLEKFTNILVQAEIEHEIAITYLDEELLSYLQACDFEKLVITSDFYMSADKVSTILAAHPFPFPIDALFLSCDVKLNKRSGRLFDYICSRLDIATDMLAHIGDNKYADIKMAEKCGIKAIHLFGEKETVKRKKYHSIFNKRQLNHNHRETLILTDELQAEKSLKKVHQEKEKLVNYGRYMSPLFTGFALYIQEVCNNRGHDKVHFFTREGKFFKEVFDIAQNFNVFEMKKIDTNLLPVSRLATFFPSLNELTPEGMMRMWSQYHTQSINSFLRSLGVDPQLFFSAVKSCGIDPEEMIESPWRDERFLALFNDDDFSKILKEEYSSKRKNLLSYFKECGFGNDGGACIVDIGWRGTIQDNLAWIFPELTIDGCYLGLQDFFNQQPGNTSKYGYIADLNRGEEHVMLKYVMPYEMLCFGTGGSAVGYTRGQSGKIIPEFRCDSEEDRIHNERIHFFQQGVIEDVDRVCENVAQHGISIQELRHEARILAENFFENPPVVICKAFNALKQDDTFGMARTIFPGVKSFKLSDRLLTYFSSARRDRFLLDLEMSGWPQCLLRTRYFGLFHLVGNLKKILLRR